MSGEQALKRLATWFRVRAESYRTTTNDPHGITQALYVAMLESASACDDALIGAEETENGKAGE